MQFLMTLIGRGMFFIDGSARACARALTKAQKHTRTRTFIDPLAHQCVAISVRVGIFSKI